MKNLIKSFLFTMTFLLIICKPGVASTFATPNIELQGNANGIVFIQGDEPFLWSDNMLPGDKFERSILLNNKYDNSYKIFMRAERVSKKEDYDLLEKTKLKVLYDGNCIYDGAISGQNGLENNIYLGSVEPGECKKLEAFAEFPGSELGNEYKNKKVQVDWIFTAVRVGDEDNENISGGKEINEGNIDSNKNNIKDIIKKIIVPKTGDSSLILYFIIFSLCSIVLLALNNNFIKNKIKIFKKEE